jgi:S1-C subfamily serine protease
MSFRNSIYFIAVSLLIALLSLAVVGQSAEMRTWTSKAGQHSVEAEFVELKDNGMVVLKLGSGKTIEVPLDKLSSQDQAHVRFVSSTTKPLSSIDGQPKAPAEIEAEASQARTAKEAVMLYKFYLAKPNLSASQRAAAEAGMAEWKKKADADQVRVGKKWMSGDEAEKIRKQATEKVEHAIEFLRLRNEQLAEHTLEEASKLDPDSIEADFVMGILYGALANNDKKAQQHFEKCLQREPNNVSVLNNLAVSLTLQKKYPEAARHWIAAASNGPKSKELSQNIGSLISIIGSNQVKIPPKTLHELSHQYEELVSTHGNPRPTQVGFFYMPPYGATWWSDDEKGRSSAGNARNGSESVVVGSGTGFVVAPHVILTNRHVVEHASGLLVLNPKNPSGEPFAAELISISDGVDLALVRCDALDAPAVPLVETLPPRGSDIMVLGYPLGPAFGKSLKSTRGAMVAMPDATLDNMCLYDAITNPGNSGGPLCDKSARVAGVVRAVTGDVGGSYGAAIPIANAMPFLRSHIPDLAPPIAESKDLDWPAVDAKISPSTVLILKKENLRGDVSVGKR